MASVVATPSASLNCSAEVFAPCCAGGDNDNVSTDRLG